MTRGSARAEAVYKQEEGGVTGGRSRVGHGDVLDNGGSDRGSGTGADLSQRWMYHQELG